jgi:hypothetical protein
MLGSPRLATVKGPPRGPGPQGPKVPTTARNAAGKQARATPKGKYQRPHRVHTEEEERIAEFRHHQAVVEEEAHKRHVRDTGGADAREADEPEEDQYKIEGFTFDDRRKKKGKKQEDEEDEAEDGEAAAEAAQAAKKSGLLEADGAGRYFQDVPQDRLGDLGLTNPNEMKRVLGATSRFAQHAMLLAQQKIDQGESRGDAIAFLARFYIELGDREYAKKALREFGPGTGILDIYPLEVVEHLLEFVPSFFHNVQRGRFFTSSLNSQYRAKAGEIITLTYPPELKIRGFALKGGERPGYLLEPTDPPGTYALSFQSSGTYQILVSAIGRAGAVFIEEMVCEIEEGDAASFEAAAAIQRERAAEQETSAEADPKKKPKEKDAEPLDSDLQIHLKQRI